MKLSEIYLPAGVLCKEFGRAWSGSKLFDTLMVFFQKKMILKKVCKRQKSMQIYPACNELDLLAYAKHFWYKNRERSEFFDS